MKKLFIIALTIITATECMAWGQKGHDTTCTIAQRHLSKKALQKVEAVLDGKSMIYWANWLDNASNTPEYSYSKTWHYKNIDADQTYDSAPLLETGNIVGALNEQVEKLRKGGLTHEEEQLALKMVIHLFGDLHQPLHLGHKSDLGGNRWRVQFFRDETNLHSTWDTNLVESGHKWSHTEWAEEIDRASKEEQDSLTQGTIDDWARETYAICQQVYAETPQDSKLSYDYVARWTPVVEQQFLKGGLRLAKILNEIYSK